MDSDFADEFPSAEVIGTDLSPIQPLFVSPNCKFEIDDACSEWAYTPNSFDFIHVRAMYGSVADWPAFYKEVFKYIHSRLSLPSYTSSNLGQASQTRRMD